MRGGFAGAGWGMFSGHIGSRSLRGIAPPAARPARAARSSVPNRFAAARPIRSCTAPFWCERKSFTSLPVSIASGQAVAQEESAAQVWSASYS